MQKGKSIGSKTGYLQEPLRGCRLEHISNSGGWRWAKGWKPGKMRVYYYSSWIFWLLYHPHTTSQQLTLGRSGEAHSMEKLKIKALDFGIPDKAETSEAWFWKQELSESLSTEGWECELCYSPCTSVSHTQVRSILLLPIRQEVEEAIG